MSQSDETRIALLEQSTTNIMDKLNEFQILNKEEHEDIIKSLEAFHSKTNESFVQLNKKLDCALEKKADKTIVDELKVKVEDLNNWKLKILGAISVLAVLFSIFKEQITNIFK